MNNAGAGRTSRLIGMVGIVALFLACSLGSDAGGPGQTEPITATTAVTSASVSSSSTVSLTTTSTLATSSSLQIQRIDDGASQQHGVDWWLEVGKALAPLTLPSDCGLPLESPESLPNAGREYRGGVHQGVDFICLERGRMAVAAISGRVVAANGTYVDPEPAERDALLEIARDLGYTPPWTLQMLYGRFVVLDHGIIPEVGHVVTVYAHLDQVATEIRPGLWVEAGLVLGEIGNRGTETASVGGDRPQSIHLHWEIYVNESFLGSGLTADETADVYGVLFGVDAAPAP